MTQVQAAVRLQQRTEELCAAAIRAMAGESDLHFRGHRLHRRGRTLPLFAAHLHPSPEHDDLASFRGAADGLALRLLHSDPALHASLHVSLAPAGAAERSLFDLLEQVRVESLAPDSWSGVHHNLQHRHAAWARGFHAAGHTEGAVGLLLFTVAVVCRARVTGEPIDEATQDLLEATRAGLAPLIGTALAGLRRERFDQRAYAAHALAIARVVGALLASAGAGAAGHAVADRDDAARRVFGFLVEPEGPLGERYAAAVAGRARTVAGEAEPYRIHTTRYDREDRPHELARPAVLAELRQRLDARVEAQHVQRARLVQQLRALFSRPQRDGWNGELEEGLVDGRRLASLIASPSERRLFRQEHIEPVADAVVTFLVDCSGSMKAHAESVAVLVDTFARALEEAGVACEILGYTTASWNGGRARRDWLRAGKPAQPGRLNERTHIVFKNGDAPWRQARAGIAALLKADLFREGIDGEAVDWACERLAARSEETKLLLVISDGSPMDSATALANGAAYLDRHLQQVVARHEREGHVQVFGIGVGLDLSAFYRRSHVLDLGSGIGNAMFREVMDLMNGRRRR